MSATVTRTGWMNGMGAHLSARPTPFEGGRNSGRGLLRVRGVPLLARLALFLGGELLAVFVADVAVARAARHVLATFHATAHVQPAAGAGGRAREAGGAGVGLGALEED